MYLQNRNYNCHSCQEPLKISPAFHQYVVWHGDQRQSCGECGAIHLVTQTTVTLEKPGVLKARLSPEYPFPECRPHRTGAYRVWFTLDAEPAKRLTTWDGNYWRNGPIVFSDNAVKKWQGLGGDMEHMKKVPFEYQDPFPFARVEFIEDESCD